MEYDTQQRIIIIILRMEYQQQIEKAARDIRLEFAKYNQQAVCNFQITKKFLQGSCKSAISQEILHNIMKVETPNRTEWMINALVKLTCKLKFFLTHPQAAVQCCKYIQYRKIPAHTEIISYGDDPDFFYVIFEGQVAIFIKRSIQEVEQDRKLMDIKLKEQSNIIIDPDTEILNRKHFIHKNICKFKFASFMREGESFGELGMLYNKPRMAIVIAKTSCVVGVLRKQDYLSIFFEQEKHLRNRKKKFISEVVFTELQNLRYEAMQGILYRFQQKTLRINDYLFKENEPFKTFYIVYEGEVLLFCWVGRFKKPIARIGQGGVICIQELKTFLNKGQSPYFQYSAQVSTSSVIVYKLEASDVLKVFDYREVFGSILKTLPESRHQQSRNIRPILKNLPAIEQKQKVNNQNINNYLKSIIMQGIPNASKQAVAINRIKKSQSSKRNSKSQSKFRMSIVAKPFIFLNENTTLSSSFAGRRISISSTNYN